MNKPLSTARKTLALSKTLALAALPKRSAIRMVYRFEGWRDPELSKHDDEFIEAAAPSENEFRDLSFTFAIIALSAQVVRAGGTITPEKYAAFREAFPLRGGICRKIRKLFILACSDETPPSHYVTQIKFIFPKNEALFRSLVERLFLIACSGGITPAGERMIARIARGLDIPAPDYVRIHERASAPKAHEILGLKKRAKTRQIKQRYRELMRKYHPDLAGNLSPEVMLLMQLKTTEINEAYRRLSRKAA